MLWVFLAVAAVAWVAVFVIVREQGSALVVPLTRSSAAWGKARSFAERAGGWVRGAWDHRSALRARRSIAGRFSSADGQWTLRRDDRIRWRDRVVALMQLILFVVLLSALFAGALAAAAIRIGHFHS